MSEVWVAPEGCHKLQRELEDTQDFIHRAQPPEEGTEKYDSWQEMMSGVLTESNEAFAGKPAGCQMVQGEDDRYECANCGFYCHIR